MSMQSNINVVVSLIGGLPIYETISLAVLNRPGEFSTDNYL